MNNNEFVFYIALGHDEFMQYQQYKEVVRAINKARLERERRELIERLKYIGSVLWHSLEPTADFIQKWDNVKSEHPNIEKCFIAGEYALKVGKILHEEYDRINWQY